MRISRRSLLLASAVGAGALLVQPHSAYAAVSRAEAADEADARRRVDAWSTDLSLPPGATSARADVSSAFALQETVWWVDRTVVSRGYWTIAGATIASAANWLNTHPTVGLLVPTQVVVSEKDDIDVVTVANLPFLDALEGIAYTVAKTKEGVAIRAEIGAIPASSARPNGDPSILGGPGQG